MSSIGMVPRLRFVTPPPVVDLPAVISQAQSSVQPGQRALEPMQPQTMRLSFVGSLLAPPAAPTFYGQLAPMAQHEPKVPPWHATEGQAAALEALAGIPEPEAEAVQALPTPQARAGEARPHAAQQTQTTDAGHPPKLPATVSWAQQASPSASAPGAQAHGVAQANQTAAQAGVQAQQSLAHAPDALVQAGMREGPATMQRPELPRDLSAWLALMQRPHQASHLLRLQEQLVLPMLSRQRLRIGGVIGSDIDTSHETEGARATGDVNEVLGVAELPQKRLEGFDLRQPLRLFYDLLSRRRRAQQKLTRIHRT